MKLIQNYTFNYIFENHMYMIFFEVLEVLKKGKKLYVLTYFDSSLMNQRKILKVSIDKLIVDLSVLDLLKKNFNQSVYKNKYIDKLYFNRDELKELNQKLKKELR